MNNILPSGSDLADDFGVELATMMFFVFSIGTLLRSEVCHSKVKVPTLVE